MNTIEKDKDYWWLTGRLSKKARLRAEELFRLSESDVRRQMLVPEFFLSFSELGYTFERSCRDRIYLDKNDNCLCEVDVFAENLEYAMAVQIRINLTDEDIQDHTKQMVKLRNYADAHGDNRKYIGAIAAPLISDSMRLTIQKAGFFAIEPSEESVKIVVPEGFRPKEW